MWNTVFTVMDKKKRPSDEEIQKIPSFMFMKWLGGNSSTIFAANQINFYYHIPIVNQYDMIKQSFAGNNLYIKMPKSKENTQAVDEILARHFKINIDKVQEYKDIIGDKEASKIIDMYSEIN